MKVEEVIKFILIQIKNKQTFKSSREKNFPLLI